VVIANWPRPRRTHWKTLLGARAIENQAFVVGVNRVGNDPRLEYAGDSLVIGPDGSVLLDCEEATGLLCLDIDPEVVNRVRRSFPVLQDRTE